MRFKLAMLIIGGVICFKGFEEFKLSGLAQNTPTALELEVIEKDSKVENAHLKIGEHISLYEGLIYEYQQSKYDKGEPGPSTKLNHAYYPIISLNHDFTQGLNKYVADLQNGAVDVAPPQNIDFNVLVKTDRFETLGSVPEAFGKSADIQGMVINEIDSLDDEELGLLKDSFPGVDFSKVLILEEGRLPASALEYLGMMGGGILLSLLGIFLMVGNKNKPALA